MIAMEISRRNFLKKMAVGSAFISLGSVSPYLSGCSKKKIDTRPNFLVILPDDLGWHDVEYHGSQIMTPNINKLIDFGVDFTHFYVYPTCSPTRASLLTGRPPSRFGVLSPIGGRSKLALPKDTATLPELLRRNGYATAITGKWHLGLRPEVGPNKYGFEYAYGYLHGQIDQYSHEYKNGDRSWHRNGHFIDEKGHATDLITREAISYLKEKRDKQKPFFLYVPFSVPHYPLQEPDKWVAPYESIFAEKSRRLFAASVTHMDDAIGKILQVLKDENIQTNTFVLFISDNGGQKEWFPKNEYNHRHGPDKVLGNNKPLRGWKGDLYEGGIRVPAAGLWFSKISPQKVNETIHIMDIYPTLAYLAGIKIQPEWHIEGKNVWETILNNKPIPERILYWRTPSQIAIRKGDWKLINKGKSPESGKDELYNLAQDPDETIDFSLDYPDKVAELLGEMKQQYQLDKM